MNSEADLGAGPVRLAIISDTHIGGLGNSKWHGTLEYAQAESYLHNAVAQANEAKAHALFALGDLTDRGDAEAMRLVRGALSAFHGDVVVVPGNHDRTVDNQTFEVEFAHGPDRVASSRPHGFRLETGHVHGIDVHSHDDGRTCSAAPPDTTRWPGGLAVVLSHYPLLSVRDQLAGAGLRDSGQLSNAEEVLAPIRHRADPTLVLSGHVHARLETTQGAALQLSVASLIEDPHELTLVDLTANTELIRLHVSRLRVPATAGNDISSSSRARPADAGGSLPVLAPHAATWSWTTAGWTSKLGSDSVVRPD